MNPGGLQLLWDLHVEMCPSFRVYYCNLLNAFCSSTENVGPVLKDSFETWNTGEEVFSRLKTFITFRHHFSTIKAKHF